MGIIKDAFDLAFRDSVTAGVPGTGANEPIKSEVRSIGPAIEQMLSASGIASAIYPTTAAGIAATTDGQLFLVEGAGDRFADLYKNVGGSAVAQGVSLPSTIALDEKADADDLEALSGTVVENTAAIEEAQSWIAAEEKRSKRRRIQNIVRRAMAWNPDERPTYIQSYPGTTVSESGTVQTGMIGYGMNVPEFTNLFTVFGGTAVLTGSGFYVFKENNFGQAEGNLSGYVAGSGGQLVSSDNALGWGIGIATDSKRVQFSTFDYGAGFRLFVDDQVVEPAGRMYGGVGGRYELLTFPDRRWRNIILRGQGGNGFYGVAIDDDGSSLGAYRPPDEIVVAFDGDSFFDRIEGAGTDAIKIADTMVPHRIARRLFGGGVKVRVNAVGGTGLFNDGRVVVGGVEILPPRSTAIQRVDRLIALNPDVVIADFLYNDYVDASTEPTARAGYIQWMQAVRAGLPDVPIFIIGPWAGAGGQFDGITIKEAAARNAVVQLGDPSIFFIPQNAPLAEQAGYLPWMTTANAPLYIEDTSTGGDGVHPNALGTIYLGDRSADQIRNIILSDAFVEAA
ncbi:SGNH/GDSL hydrolase family protein [Sphingobium yanoikuyae]|uniref:SGNH/GDSL hydrolase family protein n=1 Tax=Sphingobium yanoikuyae TaxID=13690 RepID=UPI003F12A4A8